MRTTTRTSIALVGLISTVLTATGQSRNSEHTLALDDPKNTPKASIHDIAWLAGHWQGPAFGGEFEEYWSSPAAGAMMGMFRLIRRGQTVFYEFIRAAEENGSLVIRLKHFHPDLKGWEEKDGAITFRLVKLGKEEAWFEGMTFKKTGPDSITAYVVIGKKGETSEVAFRYSRAPR